MATSILPAGQRLTIGDHTRIVRAVMEYLPWILRQRELRGLRKQRKPMPGIAVLRACLSVRQDSHWHATSNRTGSSSCPHGCGSRAKTLANVHPASPRNQDPAKRGSPSPDGGHFESGAGDTGGEGRDRY